MSYMKLNDIMIGALFFSTAFFSFSTAQADGQTTHVCIQAYVGSNIQWGVIGDHVSNIIKVVCPKGEECGKKHCDWFDSRDIINNGIQVEADDAYNGNYNTVCSSDQFKNLDINKEISIKLNHSDTNNNFWCEWSQKSLTAKPNMKQLPSPPSAHKDNMKPLPSPPSAHKDNMKQLPSPPSAHKGQLKK
ncbi:MAG TPA: hypothetical protein VMW10_07090 [Alphaproteobacteria bacterium]|nr:hypothetical protein [Alphaproteobacteria bacterium]